MVRISGVVRSLTAGVVCAIVLAACGGGGAGTSTVYPRFDPLASDVPFNSDIVFAGSTDGTADVGAPTDAVRLAVNQLDGFSTSAYFDVLLSGRVDPATVQPGQSVWLIELATGSNDPLDLANVTGIAGTASFDTRTVSLDGGTDNAVRLRPTEPLKPRTKYLVALTNDLRTSEGRRVEPSPAYAAIAGAAAIDASLVPLRGAVQAWEGLAAAAIAGGGLRTVEEARRSLVLTYTFTTTDTERPLLAVGASRAVVVQRQVEGGADPAAALTLAQTLESANALPSPRPRPLDVNALTGIDFNAFSSALAANVGRLYTGYIKLPYYLTPADAAGLGFGDFLTRPWQPDVSLASALSETVPLDRDGSRNVTWRYPFPALTATESVPLQVTLPQASWVPGYAGAANCGQIYASTGYPTVIYVHGVTSDRTSVLALAHSLASRCIATVAIDLPLHGIAANSALVNVLNVDRSSTIPFGVVYGADAPRERHFEVAGPTGQAAPMNFGSPTANDGSGAQFINLAHLTVTRDHSRQAVSDLLNLSASLGQLDQVLNGFDTVGLDLNRVSVVGVSLGGIIGSVFVANNERARAADADLGLTSPLTELRSLVANVAGTQVSQILARSQTFAPTINAGLAAAGVQPGTSDYERFLYTAQAAVDVADPVNFMAALASQGKPVLVQQVDGDNVVPNAADEAPLAGTAAMARLLGASPLGLGQTLLGRGYVRLNAGGHGSLLIPSGGAPAATAELQTQVVTFVLNNGGVSVGGGGPDLVVAP